MERGNAYCRESTEYPYYYYQINYFQIMAVVLYHYVIGCVLLIYLVS